MSICVVGVCSSIVQHTVNRTEGTICLPQPSSVNDSSVLLSSRFPVSFILAARHCNLKLGSRNTKNYVTYNSTNHLRWPHLRSALFWNITQCIVQIPSRHFGTTYRSQFQGSRIQGGIHGNHAWPRLLPI